MVIQSSTVGMQSTYSYSQREEKSVTYTSWGNVIDSTNNISASTLPSATDSVQKEDDKAKDKKDLLVQLGDSNLSLWNVIMGSGEEETYEGIDKLEHDSLQNLMELMSMKGKSKRISATTLFQQLMKSYRERMEKMLECMGCSRSVNGELTPTSFDGATAMVQPTEVYGEELTLTDFYQESEQTTFTSSGLVCTEDGREINFNVSATMSRSFLSYTSASIDYVSATFIDPLVINLGEDTGTVSDQKFLFDIDTDGELDNISLLTKHCGFLALDVNKDGTINNGSELFGTKTQDGFGELAIYDMDHNNWIDEKDEIFNHLRIWHKDDTGKDELIALGIAGVGAIYLGKRITQFSLKDSETNDANARIQATGIYLKEDGSAGTIQHIDFAK